MSEKPEAGSIPPAGAEPCNPTVQHAQGCPALYGEVCENLEGCHSLAPSAPLTQSADGRVWIGPPPTMPAPTSAEPGRAEGEPLKWRCGLEGCLHATSFEAEAHQEAIRRAAQEAIWERQYGVEEDGVKRSVARWLAAPSDDPLTSAELAARVLALEESVAVRLPYTEQAVDWLKALAVRVAALESAGLSGEEVAAVRAWIAREAARSHWSPGPDGDCVLACRAARGGK